jgi:hypothetical protein
VLQYGYRIRKFINTTKRRKGILRVRFFAEIRRKIELSKRVNKMMKEKGFKINLRNSDFVIEAFEKAYRILNIARARFEIAPSKADEDNIVDEAMRAVFLCLPSFRLLSFNQLSILLSQQHIIFSYASGYIV